jgi:AraC-like DNA-binding protein
MNMAPSSTATSTSSPGRDLSTLPWRISVDSSTVEDRAEAWSHSTERPTLSIPSHDVEPMPSPPPEWAVTTNLLAKLAHAPVSAPSWWKTEARFRAGIETWTEARGGRPDPLAEQSRGVPSVVLLLSLAGWGHVDSAATGARRLVPGTGLLAADSTQVVFSVPEGSPGWTFIRLEIFHPYLASRLMNEARGGAVIEVGPNDGLTSTVVRLVRGAIVKDFQDGLEAEMALFEFAIAFERWTRRATVGVREAERFLDEVRMQVLAKLPRAVEVCSLAKNFGMSRSYFSCLFRERTGMTPAHFATEVRIQKVERMLLDTHEPLKTIAIACGFANANHLCKVFRRFRKYTPTAFRRELRVPNHPRSVEAPKLAAV